MKMAQEKNKLSRSNPEILFLFPVFNDLVASLIFDYHLGTSYILAYLKKRGINGAQFIYKEPIGIKELTKKILALKPSIVGFTCYDAHYYFIKLICTHLKQEAPDLTILIGGPTATFSDRLIMEDTQAIDICVRGEAEFTVYKLLKHLRIRKDVSAIKGISYRRNSRIVQVQDSNLVKGEGIDRDLDVFPSPYLSDIFPQGENIGLVTSRGCIYDCIFCNYSSMSKHTIRYHSIGRVIGELKKIENDCRLLKKDPIVDFMDNTFSLNKDRAKEICRRIINENIRIKCYADTRADVVDDELLYLMKEAGFYEINFGLESASEKVLRIIKKTRNSDCVYNRNNFEAEKIFLSKTKRNILLAQKIGLDVTVSVMTGLPGETLEDARTTIKFVKSLKPYACYHNYLRIYPGTKLFDTYNEYSLGLEKSLGIIPYNVRYAYDISKAPTLRMHYQTYIDRKLNDRVLMLVTGNYNNYKYEMQPDVVFLDLLNVNKGVIDWLCKIISIAPITLFLFRRSINNKSPLIDNIKKFVSWKLPLINSFSLISSKKTKSVVYYRLNLISDNTELYLTNSAKTVTIGNALFIPFAKFSLKVLDKINKRNNNKEFRIIFTLDTKKDFKCFLKFLDKNLNSKDLIEKIIKSDFCFKDECKWLEVQCPAFSLKRLFINSAQSIRVCSNGDPVGKAGDTKEKILSKIIELKERTLRRRGCATCEVKDRCSKCLFPFPLTDDEFCDINKHRTWIKEVINTICLAREIKLYLKGKIRKADSINRLFDGHIFVKFNDKKYIYNQETKRLYEEKTDNHF